MARIRSIKPQFWSDVKIASLKNKLAGYFFIGLWNFADDEGKFPFDPKALSLHMPIFRSKEVVTYLSELSQKGLIRKSACSQWGVITNWNHQKINRPIVPKVKKEEIQWLEHSDSLNVDEDSVNAHCKDRIGKDRIGVDVVKHTPTPQKSLANENTSNYNSAHKFEVLFKPENEEFRKIIDELEIKSMPSLKRIIPQIAESYEYNHDAFRSWCESAINSKAMKNIDNANDRARYFVAAIKREIGLTK